VLLANNSKRGSIWSFLPGTEKEIEFLQNTLKTAKISTQTFSKMEATEESIKDMSGHSPGILHIATHGFYLPFDTKKTKDKSNDKNFSLIEDPMFRSGLILAGGNLKWKENIDVPGRDDGILTAYEISQLDLSKTELVVLSACETGLGDIQGSEGVYGLQRGFKSAGVKNMIITLWQIPDKESSEFMGMFYTLWLKDKKDISAAFLETQKYFSTLYPKDASKWAAFILVQ
jgi:CHAT domain-containing protein